MSRKRRSKLTRQDYLQGNCSHQDYYMDIAREVGIAVTSAQDASEFLELHKKDALLNQKPLDWWDSWASSLMLYNGKRVRSAFLCRGDSVSKASLVALVKTVAVHAALEFEAGRLTGEERSCHGCKSMRPKDELLHGLCRPCYTRQKEEEDGPDY